MILTAISSRLTPPSSSDGADDVDESVVPDARGTWSPHRNIRRMNWATQFISFPNIVKNRIVSLLKASFSRSGTGNVTNCHLPPDNCIWRHVRSKCQNDLTSCLCAGVSAYSSVPDVLRSIPPRRSIELSSLLWFGITDTRGRKKNTYVSAVPPGWNYFSAHPGAWKIHYSIFCLTVLFLFYFLRCSLICEVAIN